MWHPIRIGAVYASSNQNLCCLYCQKLCTITQKLRRPYPIQSGCTLSILSDLMQHPMRTCTVNSFRNYAASNRKLCPLSSIQSESLPSILSEVNATSNQNLSTTVGNMGSHENDFNSNESTIIYILIKPLCWVQRDSSFGMSSF